jgi:hydroxymethylpyrimidine/phosphomethylpyrimidine kinase
MTTNITAESRMPKVPRALTIAGSDSGGGAGIQADLKTFAALQVHGMSVITAITAQNTTDVRAVHDVPPDIIRAQIEAVVEDIGIDAAKTGMLHTTEIIRTVAEKIRQYRIPVVVDPVMISKSGAKLLRENAVEALKNELLPLATVVTPNAREAEVLAQMRILNTNDAKLAAKRIAELGPLSVIVKGGHIPVENKIVDTVYFDNNYHEFSASFINRRTDHGTGCSFSAAITAELAKGKNIPDAVDVARKLITSAILHGTEIGKGHGPVNPMSILYREAEKTEILSEIKQAIQILEENSLSYRLIPESQSNIGMSLREPESAMDVAAVPGRIVKIGRHVKASAPPQFGASRHVASAILTAMRFNPSIKSAMNILYLPALPKACERLGLIVSHYNRAEEPEGVKSTEGATIPWGTEQAIKRIQRIPDVLYHAGDYGKEPMAVILGRSASEVAMTALRIAEALDNG